MRRHIFTIAAVICAVFSCATADFRKDALDLHNRYRAEHHSPPLALSNELNRAAQKWAQKMARSNKMRHSNGKYGENVYMTTDTKMTNSEAAMDATTQWYNEKSLYNYRFGKFASSTGHFTQVIWKDSKYLGVGVARSSKGVYVCANYDPPGNVQKGFAKNVLSP